MQQLGSVASLGSKHAPMAGSDAGGDAGLPGALKGIKMSPEEQHFLLEYRRLEDLEREKGIKFF